MNITRRSFLQAAMPCQSAPRSPTFEALAAPARNQIKITAIKALQTADTGTIVRIETDAGLVGYGPCHGTGPFAREVIKKVEGGRVSNVGLGLAGKDPLAIKVHFHNLFYAYAQRDRPRACVERDRHRVVGSGGEDPERARFQAPGRELPRGDPLYSHCGHTGTSGARKNGATGLRSWWTTPPVSRLSKST